MSVPIDPVAGIISVTQGGAARISSQMKPNNWSSSANKNNNSNVSGIGRSLLAHKRQSAGTSSDDLQSLASQGHHPDFQTAEPKPLNLNAPVQGLRRVARAHGTLAARQMEVETDEAHRSTDRSNFPSAQQESQNNVEEQAKCMSELTLGHGDLSADHAQPPPPPRLLPTHMQSAAQNKQKSGHSRTPSTLGPLVTFGTLNSSARRRQTVEIVPDTLGDNEKFAQGQEEQQQHDDEGNATDNASPLSGSALRAQRIVSFDLAADAGAGESESRNGSIHSLVSQGWGWFNAGSFSGRLSGALSNSVASGALSGALSSAFGALEQTWAGTALIEKVGGHEAGNGSAVWRRQKNGGADAGRDGLVQLRPGETEKICRDPNICGTICRCDAGFEQAHSVADGFDGAGDVSTRARRFSNDTESHSTGGGRNRRSSTYTTNSFGHEFEEEDDIDDESDHYDSHDDQVFTADEDEPPPIYDDHKTDDGSNLDEGRSATQFSFQNGDEQLIFNFD